MSPPSLDEAASIDGASQLGIFLKINLRTATPATIVVFIFSLVWNWNNTSAADTYFGSNLVTLPLALEQFRDNFLRMYPSVDTNSIEAQLNEGIEMAAAVLSIIPLLLIYVLVERRLIESIDKTFKHQEDLQVQFNSGTVIHIYLEGAITGEQAKSIIYNV